MTGLVAAQSSRQSWVAVAMLSAMFALSMLDRMILSVVAVPLMQDLRIDDASLGLLMGTGFALLYSLAGLPLAHLIDKGGRIRLLCAGVAFWGVTTILSGFASNYATLFVLRCGLAIGEAVMTPAAVSLIADLFTRERRGLPIAVYTSVGSLMTTGSFAIGGLALAVGSYYSGTTGMAPWRIAFILCGLPALLLALLFPLLVREPPSRSRLATAAISVRQLLDYVRNHWRLFAPVLLGGGVTGLFSLSLMSWLPTIMARELGMDAAHSGYRIGMIVTPLYFAAIYGWPWLAVRIDRRHHNGGIPICLVLSALFALPLFSCAPFVSDPELFIPLVGLSMVAVAAWSVLCPLAIQLYAPAKMRARLSAVFLLVVSVFGYGFGPVMTVYLGDFLAGMLPNLGGRQLSLGLAANGATSAILLLGLGTIAMLGIRSMPQPDD